MFVSVSEEELIKLRARVAEVNERMARMTSDLDDLSERIRAVTVTAESADKLVKATVGHDGMLTKLELHPDVYDYHEPDELADQIEQTLAAASHEARQRVMAACSPFVTQEQMQAAVSHDYRSMMQSLFQGETT